MSYRLLLEIEVVEFIAALTLDRADTTFAQ